MQGFLHSRFFSLGAIAVLAAVAFQFYPSDSIQTQNTVPTESYSFEATGKLKQQTKSSANTDKLAEELRLSAIDIMKQTDVIMATNPMDEPIAAEQKQLNGSGFLSAFTLVQRKPDGSWTEARGLMMFSSC
jgi:hypothetical protein